MRSQLSYIIKITEAINLNSQLYTEIIIWIFKPIIILFQTRRLFAMY